MMLGLRPSFGMVPEIRGKNRFYAQDINVLKELDLSTVEYYDFKLILNIEIFKSIFLDFGVGPRLYKIDSRVTSAGNNPALKGDQVSEYSISMLATAFHSGLEWRLPWNRDISFSITSGIQWLTLIDDPQIQSIRYGQNIQDRSELDLFVAGVVSDMQSEPYSLRLYIGANIGLHF